MNEKGISLIESILSEAEYNESASAWIEHLTLEERELIENPAELRCYRDNIYRCVVGFANRYKICN